MVLHNWGWEGHRDVDKSLHTVFYSGEKARPKAMPEGSWVEEDIQLACLISIHLRNILKKVLLSKLIKINWETFYKLQPKRLHDEVLSAIIYRYDKCKIKYMFMKYSRQTIGQLRINQTTNSNNWQEKNYLLWLWC